MGSSPDSTPYRIDNLAIPSLYRRISTGYRSSNLGHAQGKGVMNG
ncbi:hypothetical protein L479_02999 [Exiguobacterium sp. S17]|nr:hypothetical protein L479_02999 [Exiguobacterium sp. S17]